MKDDEEGCGQGSVGVVVGAGVVVSSLCNLAKSCQLKAPDGSKLPSWNAAAAAAWRCIKKKKRESTDLLASPLARARSSE